MKAGVPTSHNMHRLIEAGIGMIRIHVQGGDKCVAAGGTLESSRSATDIVRSVSRRVDHSIPVPLGEHGNFLSAVTNDGVSTGWKGVEVASACEDGDVVSSQACLEDDVSADEDTPAENQHPHSGSLADERALYAREAWE